MDKIKNLSLLIGTIISSLIIAQLFSHGIYKLIYKQSYGAFGYEAIGEFLVILPLVYVFFLTFLFTAFGNSKKYWWIGILLIPAAVFELYFDGQHIYIPIVLGLAGWLIGWAISKALLKR